LDGKSALVKNFFKPYHRSVQHLFHGFSGLQDTSPVSLTNYPANFMEIDEIDAKHCDGKLRNIFLKIKIFD